MKIKKRTLYLSIAVLVLLLATFLYFYPANKTTTPKINKTEEEKIDGYVDNQGYLHYPIDRGDIEFKRENYSESNDTIISKVIYKSRRGDIYGFLVLPKKTKSSQLPGVVLLPGAGVTKNSEVLVAEEISKMGYAVLTIDQRGLGETGGDVPSLDQDFNIFANHQEPYSHLVVYDALRAFDLLRSAPFIDKDNIIIAGESLGGRIAMIAGAIDDNIKGVLAISSSGYQLEPINDTYADIFLKSINPDHYVDLITPRKLAMIHNVKDKNVPYALSQRTFEKANDPKKFFTINTTTCNHGYCDEMKDEVEEALEYLSS